jgi:predicted TIM-barrel fold metal-dependent hydrolase
MTAAPLIDVHAHFLHERCGVADWTARNARRLAAGDRVGITLHMASILGSWGHTSPTYFPSPEDLVYANAALRELQRARPDRIRGYVTVNPNFPRAALEEIARGLAEGMVGIKLAASRRASDPLLDPIAREAGRHDVPVLQHVWQHRRREVPGQEISDALDLGALARRHPSARFILAHIGGGGDWAHSLRAVVDLPNVFVDLSGSGVDRGMLELCLECVGVDRMLWGCDLTIDAGVGKLRHLSAMGLTVEEVEKVRWRNAAAVFGAEALGIPEGERVRGETRDHDAHRS